MRYRTIAAALEKCAAPALGIARFLASVVEVNRQAVLKKTSLRQRRGLVVMRLLKRRDPNGRFVRLTPLRDELAHINAQLHDAA